MLLLVSNTIVAQCINDVSTDHLAPNNDALPIDLLHPTGDTRYLNQFNIYPLTPGGSLEDYDLTSMYFAGVQLLEMDNIWSNQVIPYYNYISKEPIPISKNGWELLLLNVGRYPDDLTPNTSNESFQSIPYIVIYNRYSGLLRVFANFGLDQTVGNGPDAVEIILSYPNPAVMSGLLRLNEGNDRALDINSKVITTKAIAKATNTQRQWFSADIQLAYDPCVCYFPSKLQISFNQIKAGEIELYGRSLTLTDDLINPQLQVNPKDFLTSFDSSYELSNGGILAYKGVLPLINDYETRMQKHKDDLIAIGRHNELVENNLGILKMFKYIVTAVVTYGLSGTAVSAVDPAAVEQGWYEEVMGEYGDFITTSQGLFDEGAVLELVKNVIGGETATFIEQNFERLPDPAVPNKPQRVTFSEMRFTGSITETQIKGGPTFFTPGTYGSEGTNSPIIPTMYDYPIYNEALGVFAVLETPKVLLSTTRYAEGTNKQFETGIMTNDVFSSLGYQSFTMVSQMELINKIRYTLNPALDIKSVNVKAAWSIKAKEKVRNTGGRTWNSFIDPLYTVNLISKKMNLNTYDPVYRYSNESFVDTITDGWYENTTHAADTSSRNFELSTKFFELDEFHPLQMGVGLKNQFIHDSQLNFIIPGDSWGIGIEFEKIDLKLMVDVEFNTIGSDGKPNTLSQILTIPIEKEDWAYTHQRNEQDQLIYASHIDFPGLHLNRTLHETWDTGSIPDYLQIGASNFNGSAVEGCYLGATNNYICTSLNDIIINGDLTIAPGYSVEILAGNQIDVINNSIIPTEAILQISSFLSSTGENYEVAGNYVKSFCKNELTNGPSYQANAAEARNGFVLNDTSNDLFENSSNKNSIEEVLNVNVFPNPSSGTFKLSFSKSLNSREIQVFDISGRSVDYEIQDISIDSLVIRLKNTEAGIYTMNIITNEGTIFKRIVVN